MPINLCRLCGATKALQESHILPGFVYRWMKETSATGYLRFGQQPNLRVQDGLKRHLLCRDCEQRFNRWETQFANQIFHPMTQGDTARVSYGRQSRRRAQRRPFIARRRCRAQCLARRRIGEARHTGRRDGIGG
jgi:hypothetical protein